jgi:hypothetical protein
MTIGIILSLIALAELYLGIWFLAKYRKNQATMWFGLFCLGAAIYVGSNGLGFLEIFVTPDTAERLGWAGGAIATAMFLPFSFSFPLPYKTNRELVSLAVWPVALFVPGFLWTNVLLENQRKIVFGEGVQTDPGPLFWFFLVFFAIYWGWALVNMILHMRRSDGIHRWQLRMMLFGIGISLLVSVGVDIVWPLITVSRLGYIGSLFNSAWLGFTAYILLKK